MTAAIVLYRQPALPYGPRLPDPYGPDQTVFGPPGYAQGTVMCTPAWRCAACRAAGAAAVCDIQEAI